jgi:hypothetical protein
MSGNQFPQIRNADTFADVPTTDWPTPQAIEGALPPVAPYDPEMMPLAFRDWIADTVHRMQCPPDYLATTLVTVCGSLIGSRCAVKPKQRDKWPVLANVWGMIIAPPSQLKTPTTSEVLRFMNPLEQSAQSEYKDSMQQWTVDNEALEGDRKRLKFALKSKDETARSEAKKELTELEKTATPAPKLKRYKVNDCTQEKLAELCAENPQGLLSFRDEIVGLLNTFDKQGHELARGFYLEAWSGDSSYTVDRVMKGSFFIPNLCLSVFGTTQPDKIRAYLADALDGNNDGLIQRFQLMVYPDPVHRNYVDETPDGKAWATAQSVICKLAELDNFEALGAVKDHWDKMPAFRFEADAQELVKEWTIQLEAQISEGNNTPLMQEHFGKYRSLMPKLALIFHLVNVAQSPKLYNGKIRRESAEMAVKWCDYLASHARRIYNGLGAKGADGAVNICARIMKRDLLDGFTLRDIQRKGWAGLNDNKTIAAALSKLEDADWIIKKADDSEPNQSGGRPAGTAYEINPLVFQIVTPN